MIAQLKKGVLEFCILMIISKGEFYGYEIMQRITSLFDGTSEQTVYSILRRLLSDGFTECFSKNISSGPPRKYYRLTEKGIEYLEQCHKDWNKTIDCVNNIIEN